MWRWSMTLDNCYYSVIITCIFTLLWQPCHNETGEIKSNINIKLNSHLSSRPKNPSGPHLKTSMNATALTVTFYLLKSLSLLLYQPSKFTFWKVALHMQQTSLSVTDQMWGTMKRFPVGRTWRAAQRGRRTLWRTEHTPGEPSSFENFYCWVTADFRRQFQSWDVCLRSHLPHRVKPCCSDRRHTSSALKSVLTQVWVGATPPPTDQYLNSNVTLYPTPLYLSGVVLKLSTTDFLFMLEGTHVDF